MLAWLLYASKPPEGRPTSGPQRGHWLSGSSSGGCRPTSAPMLWDSRGALFGQATLHTVIPSVTEDRAKGCWSSPVTACNPALPGATHPCKNEGSPPHIGQPRRKLHHLLFLKWGQRFPTSQGSGETLHKSRGSGRPCPSPEDHARLSPLSPASSPRFIVPWSFLPPGERERAGCRDWVT